MAEGTPKDRKPMYYAVAAAAGVAGFVVFLALFGMALIPALFWGAVLAVLVLGGLLWRGGPPPFARPEGPSQPDAERSIPVDAPRPILKPASERPEAETAAPTSLVTPSKVLPGERELAARKGSWRYEPQEGAAGGEGEGSAKQADRNDDG